MITMWSGRRMTAPWVPECSTATWAASRRSTPGGEWLALDFDGRKAPYSVEMLSEIDLAYAQTVHKAQGSEYRCVVLAAMPSAPSLMVRGVLYTALTRARELLVIVGDDAAIRSMAANDRQQKRYSGLKWRLCHAGDASE